MIESGRHAKSQKFNLQKFARVAKSIKWKGFVM